ncbi:MAG: hypothetical protein WA966_16300 [Ornithinimicrobium sp.]
MSVRVFSLDQRSPLALIASVQVLVMGRWFSASAVVPARQQLLVVPVVMFWRASKIADSGLSSSCMAEVVDPRLVDAAGWPTAMAVLALGAVAGAVAMSKLYALMSAGPAPLPGLSH